MGRGFVSPETATAGEPATAAGGRGLGADVLAVEGREASGFSADVWAGVSVGTKISVIVGAGFAGFGLEPPRLRKMSAPMAPAATTTARAI
jgi:hypothetical protein